VMMAGAFFYTRFSPAPPPAEGGDKPDVPPPAQGLAGTKINERD